jgi:hypothetical protein
MSDTIIILTTTVEIFNVYKVFQQDKNDRLNTYLTAIKKWLNTDFKIIVVDNSGYTFSELETNENLHIVSYHHNNVNISEEHKFILSSTEKGHHEMLAIYQAFDNIPSNWKYEKIFKLTGRYYIPNFKHIISNIPQEALYYIQNRDVMCELYGGKKDNVMDLFKLPTIKNKKQISETIKKERIDKILENYPNKNIVYKFPKLLVDPVLKGSRNTIMTKI